MKTNYKGVFRNTLVGAGQNGEGLKKFEVAKRGWDQKVLGAQGGGDEKDSKTGWSVR